MSYTSELTALRADIKRLESMLNVIKTMLASVLAPPAPPVPQIGPYPEIRPQNAVANGRMPTTAELAAFKARFATEHTWFAPYAEKVTGAFTGTTEEILEWAARKWGLDPDIAKAVAVKESWWRQDTKGDFDGPNGEPQSFGITQVRKGIWGGYPLSELSTSFAADVCMAHLRCWLDGKGWHDGTQNSLREAVQMWFNPDPNNSDRAYADEVLRHLAAKTWRQSGF